MADEEKAPSNNGTKSSEPEAAEPRERKQRWRPFRGYTQNWESPEESTVYKASHKTVSLIGRFLRRAFKVLIVLLIIVAIYFIIFSDAGTALWLRSTVVLERLEPIITKVRTTINPVAAFNKYVLQREGFDSPYIEPQTDVYAVRISNVRPAARTFYEKDLIRMLGQAKIDPIDVDTIVQFTCSIETPQGKKDGELYITGQKGQEGANIVEIKKNAPRSVHFTCELPPVDKIQNKEFDVYKSSVDWYYKDFKTISEMPVIALSGEKKNELEEAGRDPIAQFRKAEFMKADGTSKTFCEYGCLSTVGLSLDTGMPVTDNTEYNLGVDLLKLTEGERGGKVKRLISLRITMPPDLIAEGSCPDFGNDFTLDASDSQALAAVNKLINDKKENDIHYNCVIKTASADETPRVKTIRAEAIYDYGDSHSFAVNVEKRPEGLVVPQQVKGVLA